MLCLLSSRRLSPQLASPNVPLCFDLPLLPQLTTNISLCHYGLCKLLRCNLHHMLHPLVSTISFTYPMEHNIHLIATISPCSIAVTSHRSKNHLCLHLLQLTLTVAMPIITIDTYSTPAILFLLLCSTTICQYTQFQVSHLSLYCHLGFRSSLSLLASVSHSSHSSLFVPSFLLISLLFYSPIIFP